MAAKPEEIGDLVSTAELMAYRTGNFSFASSMQDHEHFNSIVPIYNAPICYSCHDENTKVLGILNLQLSLEALGNMQSSGRNATMIASGVMLVILVLTITAFLLIYVDTPIRKLVTAMDLVENGRFEDAHTIGQQLRRDDPAFVQVQLHGAASARAGREHRQKRA